MLDIFKQKKQQDMFIAGQDPTPPKPSPERQQQMQQITADDLYRGMQAIYDELLEVKKELEMHKAGDVPKILDRIDKIKATQIVIEAKEVKKK
jgi:hypothetical protein